MPQNLPHTWSLRPTAWAIRHLLIASVLTGPLAIAFAQDTPAASAQVHPITQRQSLTDWLRAHPAATQNAHPLATAWTTPEETAVQTQAHQDLVHQLQSTLVRPEANPLAQWLKTQTATGRVLLPAVQADWLEANPERTPVLQAGDTLTTMPSHGHVTVILGDGSLCRLTHQAHAYPADYIQACPSAARHTPSFIWLIQPNGRVQALSIAHWQPTHQPQLAPNALIWVGWPKDTTQTHVTPAELNQLNQATAQWLANRTDGLADWLRRVPNPSLTLAPPPEASPEWTGLSGPRFTLQPSASNWGVVGLMQTPTARMRPSGSFAINYHRTWPYSTINLMMQPLDRLEAGFRYVDVANIAYGPESLSGSQSLKDKSFELKYRFMDESDWRPSMAIGLRDLAGTGLFSSEYVVANKRWGRFDASLGMAWGYMGGRQNLRNPLSRISSRFDERTQSVGEGGTFSTQSFFRGKTALFGGVEYQSPWGPVLKVEYDSNNYQREPHNNNQATQSPLNLGLVYRLAPALDLSIGRERGTTWSMGLTLYTDLSRTSAPKPSDPTTPRISPYVPMAANAHNAHTTIPWAQTRQDVQALTQWRVDTIQRQDKQLLVDLSQSSSPYHRPRIDKAMAVLHRDAPADIQNIQLRHQALGDVLLIDHIDRAVWAQNFTQAARTRTPPVAVNSTYPAADSTTQPSTPNPTLLLPSAPESHSLEPGISLNQSMGGPDAFWLYQLNLTLKGKLPLPARIDLHGSLNLGLINNYDRFKYDAPSALPRVRTYMREYLTNSRLTMPTLYLSRTTRHATDWSTAVYGGYLEEMFAGVGGEVMYRQPGSRWAVSADINQVQQREFSQHFGLRDYSAPTGHVRLYWQTPWQNIHMELSAGQYLAKDRGATLALSRTFDNGVTMGAFATRTNVSAAVFGEGSFNKGVFWTIPFDAMMPRSSRATASFNWTPLTRDGGAMLNRPVQLIKETQLLDPRVQTQSPAPTPQDQRIPDDRDH